MMKEIVDTFNTAATDPEDEHGNKLLSEAQFVNFGQMVESNYENKGWHLPKKDEAFLKKSFGIINKITPNSNGVSINDVWNQFAKAKEMSQIAGN